MPNDLITVKALALELNDVLKGGRIEKIYQPEKDEINLLIHNKGKYLLAISCNAETPKIAITGVKKENPLVAPPFSMLLRKHLSGAIVESVSLVSNDRIIDFSFNAKNELKDEVKFHIVAEMMGRYSNVLLLNGNSVILDAMKSVSYDTATKRCILPSMPYAAPPQSKTPISDTEAIRKILGEYSSSDVAKYLTSTISGFALVTAKEIVKRSGIENSVTALSEKDVEKLIDTVSLFYNVYESDIFAPSVVTDENGVSVDYFVTPYASFSDSFIKKDSLSEAIDSCLRIKDREMRRHDKTKSLAQSLKRFKEKNMRTLQKSKEKLIECEKTETLRKYGELITNNIYLIKKGMKEFTAYDYYDDKEVTIPLNVMLSAGANAQDYFKRYAKLKRTKDIVTKQIAEIETLLDKISMTELAVKNCYTSQDIYELEIELNKLGAIKKFKVDKIKEKKESTPFVYEINGYTLYVGKNNIQNEKLTFKTAKPHDIWLHAKNFHASHAVLVTNGDTIDESVVQTAAEIAIYYSAVKTSNAVECDYTERKNVKRHPSGTLGLVTYTNYKSIRVTANAHNELMKKG